MQKGFEEFASKVLHSAAVKGSWLREHEISPSLAKEIRARYDWCVAVYLDISKPYNLGAIELIALGKQDGDVSCNAIPCIDEATALKLRDAIRD